MVQRFAPLGSVKRNLKTLSCLKYFVMCPKYMQDCRPQQKNVLQNVKTAVETSL